MSSFEKQLNIYTTRVETFLNEIFLNLFPRPSRLHQAMHYAVFNGGKRLRPALVYATGQALNCNHTEILDAAAAAIELIHCYSLIHDDLPCIDNDTFRRGKPSCWAAFDEGTALLAGNGLQALAFQILASPFYNPHPAETRIKMIEILSKTSGAIGLLEGQSMDMDFEKNSTSSLDLETLETMHDKKTGALIGAAVHLAGIAANATSVQKQKLNTLAYHLGLAFQIQDDILDLEGSLAILGKTPGKDIAKNKKTFVTVLGLESAKNYLKIVYSKVETSLKALGEELVSHSLKQLTEFMMTRKN